MTDVCAIICPRCESTDVVIKDADADTGLTLPGSEEPLMGQLVECQKCRIRWHLIAIIEVGAAPPHRAGWN